MGGNSIVAAIDEKTFGKENYIPILEALLFAVNKYLFLGAGEREARMYRESLIKSYNSIPGAMALDENDLIFSREQKIMVIKSVPGAEQTKFNDKELVDMIRTIRSILRKA